MHVMAKLTIAAGLIAISAFVQVVMAQGRIEITEQAQVLPSDATRLPVNVGKIGDKERGVGPVGCRDPRRCIPAQVIRRSVENIENLGVLVNLGTGSRLDLKTVKIDFYSDKEQRIIFSAEANDVKCSGGSTSNLRSDLAGCLFRFDKTTTVKAERYLAPGYAVSVNVEGKGALPNEAYFVNAKKVKPLH